MFTYHPSPNIICLISDSPRRYHDNSLITKSPPFIYHPILENNFSFVSETRNFALSFLYGPLYISLVEQSAYQGIGTGASGKKICEYQIKM